MLKHYLEVALRSFLAITGNDLAGTLANIDNESASRQLGFSSPAAAVNTISRTGSTPDDLLTIGVAADTNFFSINARPRADVYSFSQRSPGGLDVLTQRFDGDSGAVMTGVAEVWREVMGDAVLSSAFVAQNLEAEFAQEKVESRLLVSFSLLAVMIACLGLYGSAAFTVDGRTKKVGSRKVLGAEVRELLALSIAWLTVASNTLRVATAKPVLALRYE
jgi:putative ABC transport system permease protein